MSIYGDYAAQIIQGRQSKELQAEARRNTLARNGKQEGDSRSRARGGARSGTRSGKAGRARVA